MIKRGTDSGYGLWSLPGGFVDRGEVVESAAAREAWEETGLEVSVESLLGLFSLPGDPVIVAAYTARETGGALEPGPEALEAAFFPPDAPPELAFSVIRRFWPGGGPNSVPHETRVRAGVNLFAAKSGPLSH